MLRVITRIGSSSCCCSVCMDCQMVGGRGQVCCVWLTLFLLLCRWYFCCDGLSLNLFVSEWTSQVFRLMRGWSAGAFAFWEFLFLLYCCNLWTLFHWTWFYPSSLMVAIRARMHAATYFGGLLRNEGMLLVWNSVGWALLMGYVWAQSNTKCVSSSTLSV